MIDAIVIIVFKIGICPFSAVTAHSITWMISGGDKESWNESPPLVRLWNYIGWSTKVVFWTSWIMAPLVILLAVSTWFERSDGPTGTIERIFYNVYSVIFIAIYIAALILIGLVLRGFSPSS